MCSDGCCSTICMPIGEWVAGEHHRGDAGSRETRLLQSSKCKETGLDDGEAFTSKFKLLHCITPSCSEELQMSHDLGDGLRTKWKKTHWRAVFVCKVQVPERGYSLQQLTRGVVPGSYGADSLKQ